MQVSRHLAWHLLPHLSLLPFLHFHLVRLPFLRRRWVHPARRSSCFGRLAEQSLLPPSIQRNKCVVPRSLEKQRRWKIVDTLQWWSGDCRVVVSHHYFRQSAQYLWSSSGLVWKNWSGDFRIFKWVPQVNGESESKVVPTVVLKPSHRWSMFQPRETAKLDGFERKMDQVLGLHQTRLDKHDAQLESQRQSLEDLKTEVSLLRKSSFDTARMSCRVVPAECACERLGSFFAHRTPCRTHFLMRTVCQVVLSGSHPSLTFHALAWLKMKLCAFSKTAHTSRNMSYITPELTSTFFHLAPALLPVLRHDLLQLPPLSILARSIPATIHNKRVHLYRLCAQRSCRKFLPVSSRCSSTDQEKLRLTILLRALRRPESDLDDGQIRALLASPLYSQERETSADRSQVCHPVREKSGSSSSQVPKSTGKPVALFSSKRKSSPETFSDREDSSLEHQQAQGNNEPFFRFSDPKEAARSFLE